MANKMDNERHVTSFEVLCLVKLLVHSQDLIRQVSAFRSAFMPNTARGCLAAWHRQEFQGKMLQNHVKNVSQAASDTR